MNAARRGSARSALVVLLGLGLAVPSTAQEPASRAVPDLPRAAVDGRIREQDLQHDSRDDRYRSPGGPIAAGTPVLLRLRAAAGDLGGALARFSDRLSGASWAMPMELVLTDLDAGDVGFDYWQVELEPGPQPRIIDYTFVAQDGRASRHLFDDRALDGGTGQIGRQTLPGRGWQLTFYDPAFATPEWAAGSVVYQIFPDRFANGDAANDPSPDAVPGSEGAARYRHADVYGNEILEQPWAARPEGHCRAYQEAVCLEGALGRDFFGGDLAGITAALDELADLGITVLYLNPIFAAPSNHRYDTSDYRVIDPDLGSLRDFDELIMQAGRLGIRVVLDGVFNHVSSDSPWFDRMRRYAEVGACESPGSPYRDWFSFREPGPGEPEPCAPSASGGSDTYYVGWFDFDTIPELRESEAVADLFVGPDGVVRQWLERGTSGWRLDVSDSMSHEFQAHIRDAAKDTDPEAIIIAEQWGDSTPWLLGDQADSTMNYRFRRAVIGLVNGDTADPDGAIEGLVPSRFASAMLGVQEDYPEPAYQALLNLVDSHDTSRILWTLTPGIDDDAAKSDPHALAEGKAALRLLSTIQMTFPGMAAIYYGDEVGLSGHDDPDDRRPYPWGDEDLALREHYRTLARLRAEHEAIGKGDLEFLLADDGASTLAYLRRSDHAAAVVAVNLSDRERTLPVETRGSLPDGLELRDALGDVAPVVTADGQLSVTLPARSAAVLISGHEVDLLAPAVPQGLRAEVGQAVTLGWDAVPEAERYRLHRSLLRGGGYDWTVETQDTSFVDTTARGGVPQYYVVTAVDAAGNSSARSAEVVGLPRVGIGGVELVGIGGADATATMTRRVELSAVDGAIDVQALVRSASSPADIAAGVVVEVGLGPADTDPGVRPDWTWQRAAPVVSSVDGEASNTAAARFVGRLQPEDQGRYAIGVRASDDGATTWTYAPDVASLDVSPSLDILPPGAPEMPELLDVSGDSVQLSWRASDAADVYRYLVLRAAEADGPFELIATTTDAVFADPTVRRGQAYVYAVQAQDTSFNASAPSAPLTVVADERVVALTFRVTVPAWTPTDDTIYVAGDFQGWDPGGTPMSRVDDTTWSITLEFDDRDTLDYKYTRGSWEAVEKDAGCGEIPDRGAVAEHGIDGTQELRDVVAKWRDVDGCG